MLDLSDIRHLPELDRAIDELIADGPGLALIAGLDAPPGSASLANLPLPSGRASLFRILTRRLLAESTRRVLVVTHARDAIRVTREDRRRVEVVAAADADEVQARLLAASGRPPELVIAQHSATPAVVRAALQLAEQGAKVLAQFNTPCRGLGVARELIEAGAPEDSVRHLHWVIASQRLPALCSCAEPHPVAPLARARVTRTLPRGRRAARTYAPAGRVP